MALLPGTDGQRNGLLNFSVWQRENSDTYSKQNFEIATAVSGVLDLQVGRQHIILETGDSIFVNKNMLHGIKQLSGDVPVPMPNIVFKLRNSFLKIQRSRFRKSPIPAAFILLIISAANFGKPMDIHPAKIALWVNSAYIGVYCVFV